MKKFLILLILPAFLLVIGSCDHRRESDLLQREEAVKARELEFEEKEADYKSLLKMRDSLLTAKVRAKTNDMVTDAPILPDSLAQSWNSKMVCRESNCGTYVIGDQRTEIWKFTSDSAGSYANVISNNKLLRRYTINYSSDKIFLESTGDSISERKARVDIVLDDIRKDIMKGTQKIKGEKDCTTTFSVELTPSQKK
ncbi:hypothetical protein [Flavobacterium sp. NRK1]|uniref:hypothetical protein n=1 Tax=Flavobacterium sp. NRK1 TaxID=2954929 RepID=UPI00209254A0|nr:hypothetical protein [Flavobacterium sp. NRK1]MCO6148900.1 hypothetical protein [Flavobacterium sp. NRK1]